MLCSMEGAGCPHSQRREFIRNRMNRRETKEGKVVAGSVMK